MAFTSTIEGKENGGSLSVNHGTFTNTGGSTGGDIDTGLSRVVFISLQHTGASAVASAPAANETFPLNSANVTIVTTADADGVWVAYGYN